MAAITSDQPWRLSPSIGLRPEPFGALAYHFVSRRLVFLKTNDLVDVVRALENHTSIDDALSAVGIPTAKHANYLTALASLAESGVIERRPNTAAKVVAT